MCGQHGALLAESNAALQRMVDAAVTWCRKWRLELRIGADKSAVMCTKGMAAVKIYLCHEVAKHQFLDQPRV